MTKFPKVRCPKGRSTALFACQKSIFRIFLAFFALYGQKMSKNTILSKFLKKLSENAIFWKFLKKTIRPADRSTDRPIDRSTDPTDRPIRPIDRSDRSTDPNKKPGGLAGLCPPSKKHVFFTFVKMFFIRFL